MTRVLNAERREPVSGETRSAVVFLHGYGANGADLLGLADPLGEHLPDTLFVAPDAPEACAGAPMGFQWFPIPWIDNSSEEEAERGMMQAVDDLNAFLDALMVDEDLLPEQVVLFGFSQGTMMALHVAPRREDAVAGVVAFSGRLLSPESLKDEIVVRPPVLLVHGDADDVVPPQSLPQARDAAGSRLDRCLCPYHEGHRPRDRPRWAERGACLYARQTGSLTCPLRRPWLCAGGPPRRKPLAVTCLLRNRPNPSATSCSRLRLVRRKPRDIVESISGAVSLDRTRNGKGRSNNGRRL